MADPCLELPESVVLNRHGHHKRGDYDCYYLDNPQDAIPGAICYLAPMRFGSNGCAISFHFQAYLLLKTGSRCSSFGAGFESVPEEQSKIGRRGRAATSFCVYACWGAPKICEGGPHSTISPAVRIAMARDIAASRRCS